MACLLVLCASRVAHPCDGSRSVETIPPESFGASYNFDLQHRAVGTRDDELGSMFTVVFIERAKRIIGALTVHFVCLTLQMWSYTTYTRYYYYSSGGGGGTHAAPLVYVSAVFGGLTVVVLIGLWFLIANWKAEDHSGGDDDNDGNGGGDTLPPRFIAAQMRERAHRARRRQQQQQQSSTEGLAAEGGGVGDASMQDISMDNIGDDAAAQWASGPGGMQSGASAGGNITRLLQVVHACRGLDHFESCPRLERSRAYLIVTRIIAACWCFVATATLMDVVVFVEVTDPGSSGYARVGPVPGLFGISLLLGTALTIGPPWFMYQKHMVKVVGRYYA